MADHSLFTIHYSLFAIYYSLFTIHQFALTRTALHAPFRVKGAAPPAANVHCAREPTGDKCAKTKDPDQDSQV